MKGLPGDSATWRDGDPWTQQDHFLAALIETVDHWGMQQSLLLGAKKHTLPKPLQIKRPDDRQRGGDEP